MNVLSQDSDRQRTLREKCFHPSGLFVEFGRTDIEQSIPGRFEAIAETYSERIALKSGGNVISYDELNSRANRVARMILRHRADRAEPVAVLVEKGIEQIAVLLGVLKANKIFVIVDPSFPKQRLLSQMKDSEIKTVLTSSRNMPLAHELIEDRTEVLALQPEESGEPSQNLGCAIAPSEPAFIVQTSGSSGQPKNVIHSHRNVLHDIRLRTNVYHICRDDRLSLLSSGTSSAINNMLLALLNGATLVLFDSHREGAMSLVRWLSSDAISICWISAPLFRSLPSTFPDDVRFPNLRLIRLASDGVFKGDVDFYKSHFPATCLLANGLAPTETGLLTTYLMDHETEIDTVEVPVGFAMQDKKIIITDESGQEVGPNRVGEIVVKSGHLALGYWRRPDWTGAKFREDSPGAETRTYLTGDLGVLSADGCLTHKGRKDFRIKIRGYGVDIAEVEAELRAHPGISDAVVVARQTESGDTYLAAYFTCLSEQEPTVTELRRFLHQKLPEYMLPSHFARLDSIPLLPNGKINRAALPPPCAQRPMLETPFVAARTLTEQMLAVIWCEVLSLDRIGINDNFFDLGGHSLSATRVISRIVQKFHVELPLTTFFEAPRISDMGVAIATRQAMSVNEQELARILTDLAALSDEEAHRSVSKS